MFGRLAGGGPDGVQGFDGLADFVGVHNPFFGFFTVEIRLANGFGFYMQGDAGDAAGAEIVKLVQCPHQGFAGVNDLIHQQHVASF